MNRRLNIALRILGCSELAVWLAWRTTDIFKVGHSSYFLWALAVIGAVFIALSLQVIRNPAYPERTSLYAPCLLLPFGLIAQVVLRLNGNIYLAAGCGTALLFAFIATS